MLRPVTYTLNVKDLRQFLGEDKVYSDETLQRMKAKGVDVNTPDVPWNQEKEKIVYTGLDRLRDGAVIQPQPMSMDSLLRARPML